VLGKRIDSMLDGRRWLTGGTMASHPLTSAAMMGTLETLIDEQLVPRAAELGRYLGDLLRAMAEKHPCVGFVDGIGLMWLIELVRNRSLRTPFVADDRDALLAGDTSLHPNAVVHSDCWENGLLVGGYTPNVIQLTPPLTVTEAECEQAVEVLDRALGRVDAML
jgi:taurine--2-oxoglutarate transaminase